MGGPANDRKDKREQAPAEESKTSPWQSSLPSREADSVKSSPKASSASPTKSSTSSPKADSKSPKDSQKGGSGDKSSAMQVKQRSRHLGHIQGSNATNMITNHFRIKLGKVSTLHQYKVTFAKNETEEEETKRVDRYHQSLQDQNLPLPGTPGYQPPGPPQILPRVRRRLFYLLIKNLRAAQDLQTPTQIDIASDYHNLLVTVFPIPEQIQTSTHVVQYYGEQERGPTATPPTYVATIETMQALPIRDFSRYLSSRSPDNTGYRAHEDDILRALNMIFGRRPSLLTFEDLEPGTNRLQGMGRLGANKFYDRYLIGYPAVPVGHNAGTTPPWGFTDVLHRGLLGQPGFFFSSRASFGGDLMLNLNSKTSAFYPAGQLTNFIHSFDNNIMQAQPRQYHQLANLLRDVRVVTTYLNQSSVTQNNGPRPERITAIADLPPWTACTANSAIIPGLGITVHAYFQQSE